MAPADYTSTCLLPKTDFPMQADLPKREPETIRRWQEIDLHGLRPLIATCFWKPRWDHQAQLVELGVEVFPDFVVDDHRDVVAAFGGVTVFPFDYFDPRDREMERVYRAIKECQGA